MQEDIHAFMERYIRERAIVANPDSPGLSPEERRAWWEFCVEMAEFLGEITRHHAVDRELAHQLSRLCWILIRGTYVFAKPDPLLRGEQRRYVELCVITGAMFALIVGDLKEIRDMFNYAFRGSRSWSNGDSKLYAEAEAISGEAWLRFLKSWEHAVSPIAWCRHVSAIIHKKQHPAPMEDERGMWSIDAPTPTGDPYGSVLCDFKSDPTEIHASLDLDIACQREGLSTQTRHLALGYYNGVPRTVAAEVLGLSRKEVVAASRELSHAKPTLQVRLASYRKKPEKR